ncbi:MAG: DUF4276 family protein [Pseudomonadota bacterium]
MATKILMLVEGQTEEKFIKDVLLPYFEDVGTSLIPKIITTKKVKSGYEFKGGVTSYSKMRNEILELLNDSSAKLVTTMIDYYGLPKDFPGNDQDNLKDCYKRVAFLEKKFKEDINNSRFLPYLQLHEFEGLLFSSPRGMAEVLGNQKLEEKFGEIKYKFKNPEEINDNPTTCPSRRIKNIFQSYEKVLHGSLIIKKIGLDAIINECPHFKEWFDSLKIVNG